MVCFHDDIMAMTVVKARAMMVTDEHHAAISLKFNVTKGPTGKPMRRCIQKRISNQDLNKKNLKKVRVLDGICVSNSFYVFFYPILAPIPNFIQIGRKTQKFKIFNNLVGFGWSGY